jgi:hypothetical protein
MRRTLRCGLRHRLIVLKHKDEPKLPSTERKGKLSSKKLHFKGAPF